FHGDMFEFIRNEVFDARNYFATIVDPLHQNQFGGTIGGPILIPHVYNGRNKTFFFFSYQGSRSAVPENSTSCLCATPGNVTVFSSAERTGQFTGLSTATGRSAFPLAGDNGTTYPAGTPYSTIFPNGQIPTADLNPLAIKLMNQFVPSPNAPGNVYAFNPTLRGLDDQYIWRIDENITPQDSAWAYGLWERHPNTQTVPFTGATVPGFTEVDAEHIQEYTADWNHIFNPNTLNEARFSYSRFNFASVSPQTPLNPAKYGFTGVFPQTLSGASLPVINVVGLFNLGFSSAGPQPRIDNVYVLSDNFSRIAGRHTLKLGFAMERFAVFQPVSSNLSGTFYFTGGGAFPPDCPARISY
ncbi:MAG: hypothetical protein ACRD10_10485, partial [Terriglobia bacterium]